MASDIDQNLRRNVYAKKRFSALCFTRQISEWRIKISDETSTRKNDFRPCVLYDKSRNGVGYWSKSRKKRLREKSIFRLVFYTRNLGYRSKSQHPRGLKKTFSAWAWKAIHTFSICKYDWNAFCKFTPTMSEAAQLQTFHVEPQDPKRRRTTRRTRTKTRSERNRRNAQSLKVQRLPGPSVQRPQETKALRV